VLLDGGDEVLRGPFKAELKAELRRQLSEFRVELLLGSPLRQFRRPFPASWRPSPSRLKRERR
jgi:hypothetical protein